MSQSCVCVCVHADAFPLLVFFPTQLIQDGKHVNSRMKVIKASLVSKVFFFNGLMNDLHDLVLRGQCCVHFRLVNGFPLLQLHVSHNVRLIYSELTKPK